HDIDSTSVDGAQFARWHNFSFCPAGAYESLHRPRVTKGRVELFANGMGISRKLLHRSGGSLRLTLSPRGLENASKFFAMHRLNGELPVIGVHAFSRDTYKDYPHMNALIAALAGRYKVVVFHHVPIPVPGHANVVPAFGLPLQDAIATFSKCNLAIC